MIPQYVEITEIPHLICWWRERLGEVCEVLEYLPETDFYKIKVDVDGYETWGGIPDRYCKRVR